MPTLLSINNYFYRRGGAEVVFLEQNRLFAEHGWKVIPFAMHHPKNEPSEWAEFFVDEIEFGGSYSLAKKALMASKVIYSFEARRKIADLAKAVRPDVAHAHNVYHHISPAIFSKLKSVGIPTVLTLHDLKLACPAYKMLSDVGVCEQCKDGALWNLPLHRCIKDSRSLSTLIMAETALHRMIGSYSRNIDRFVVPSRFYIDKFVEWGWSRDRFTYIPNFVDVASHECNPNVGNAFVFFGRLGPEKGLRTLVKAAAISRTQIKIIGAGPEEATLQDLVQQLGADVEFLGYRTGDALRDAIRKARTIVLPSEWYENAPMSVMEAYALGRPVIGARIGGIPELIRDGETGTLFDSGDEHALADAMTRFAALPDQRIAEMGRAGRLWVEKDFTAAKYRERLLSLYKGMGVNC